MQTTVTDAFDRVFRAVENHVPWGWELTALNTMKDAMLCLENDNRGGAESYAREAVGYLDMAAAGEPYPTD